MPTIECPKCTAQRPVSDYIATSRFCRECRTIAMDSWRAKKDPADLKAMRRNWYRNWVAKRKAKLAKMR